MAAYRAQLPPAPPREAPADELRRCLGTLRAVFRGRSPHRGGPLPAADLVAHRSCLACGRGPVLPFLVRGPPAAETCAEICYGRCESCGQGVRWGLEAMGAADLRACYADGGYYRHRDQRGVGYDAYAEEAAYREEKGARLVATLQRLLPAPVTTFLEVGSGYGFTRVAAARAGWITGGVDLNAEACQEGERRYGLATFRGTLGEALADSRSGIGAAAWDVVLYQFVLEHVLDPGQELQHAHRALRPGGCLTLFLPSMEALEIEVFGPSYRSFRADHLHLPTRASLRALLRRAGFEVQVMESSCNIHLFRELLSPAALALIYTSGRGPDLFVVARRQS